LGSASGFSKLRRTPVWFDRFLWFNEAVEPAFAKVWIVPAKGPHVPLTSHGDSSDQRLLIVTLPDKLAAGPVVIGYHILSVDGHVVDSQLTFTIKKPA
jgi:copper resistance protein C